MMVLSRCSPSRWLRSSVAAEVAAAGTAGRDGRRGPAHPVRHARLCQARQWPLQLARGGPEVVAVEVQVAVEVAAPAAERGAASKEAAGAKAPVLARHGGGYRWAGHTAKRRRR